MLNHASGPFDHLPVRYSWSEVKRLLSSLKRAAEIYSTAVTGHVHSHVLWNSPFPKAMCALVLSFGGIEEFSASLREIPVLWLLLADIPDLMIDPAPILHGPSKNHAWKNFLWDVFYSEALRLTQVQTVLGLEEAVDHILKPCQSLLTMPFYLYVNVFEMISAELMASGLMWMEVDGTRDVAKAFIRWFTQNKGPVVLSFRHISQALPHIIKVLSKSLLWENGRLVNSDRHIDFVENGFSWLLFILQETNSVLASASDVDFCQAQPLAFMTAYINMIRLLQALDNHHGPERFQPTYNPASFKHSVQSPKHLKVVDLHCSYLCSFRGHIERSLTLVREKAPGMRLHPAWWRCLVHSLTANCSQEMFEGTPWNIEWTSTSHRDRVKRDILKALEWLCLDPYASGMHPFPSIASFFTDLLIPSLIY